MPSIVIRSCLFVAFLSATVAGKSLSAKANLPLPQPVPKATQWGYHPVDDEESPVNPPGFTWLPGKDIVTWELAVAERHENEKAEIVHRVKDLAMITYTPPIVFKPGNYVWKYRGFDKNKKPTVWSKERRFTIGANAALMPLPPREELLGRIPKSHPRLFVRPEWIDRYRELAKNELKTEYLALVKRCNDIVKKPPKTTEPALYKDKSKWKDEADTWWGNRVKTIAVLESAATLAFVWQIGQDERYAKLAKELLMKAAEWDPVGATGYRYNDEAGMPYAYHFSRTYTFLNAYLSEEERAKCREVMTIRGKEMYKHLYPRHLDSPYASHSNRAWHFLGELGVVFHGEIPEADDWLWFAVNVFYTHYPVWCDSDGGWHEGVSYWNSYQSRFVYWADVMRATFGISAFDKPYYKKVGYYAMYLLPPGTIGGGFGDLANDYRSSTVAPLVEIFGRQSGNPHWLWYAEKHRLTPPVNYYTFIRKAARFVDGPAAKASSSTAVQTTPPTDIPASSLFAGTGLAFLNTNLLDAKDNVQVIFKSSPFGLQSHGYEANNSFFFSAWNENLLTNSGRRDIYGSPHHAKWMWSTRSCNNITVDGIGQMPHYAGGDGRITFFETHKDFDVVVGETADLYRAPKDAEEYPQGKVLDRYTRTLVFLKPDTILVHDRLAATKPATFEYWLHARLPFQPIETYFPGYKSKANDELFAKWCKGFDLFSEETPAKLAPLLDQHHLAVRVDKVACDVTFLLPKSLKMTQTNQYDPNMSGRRKPIREWHVCATTPEKAKDMEFLMLARAWKVADRDEVPAISAECAQTNQWVDIRVHCTDGREATVRISNDVKTKPSVSIQ